MKKATTATETIDLFAMAATTSNTAPATGKKAKAKPEVLFPGEIDKPARYQKLKSEFKSIEAEMAMLADDLKAFGKAEYLKRFEETGVRPESFKIVGPEGPEQGSVLYIVQDQYTKISDATLPLLEKLQVVTKTTETFINPAIVETYKSQISAALMNIVPREKWGEIFGVKNTYTVEKGTIEKLDKVGFQHFDLISPIQMLK